MENVNILPFETKEKFRCLYFSMYRFKGNFNGFNDWKRKKIKAPSLQSGDLREHVTCLINLLEKPYPSQWGDFRFEIEAMMLSLDSYATFLEESNKSQHERQKQKHPVRELKENIMVQTF